MKKPRFKNLEEAQQYLKKYAPEKFVEEAYSLDRIIRCMKLLGNPQDSYKVIHIAGTSGKTSTTYYIRNLLEAVGQKTGLTASPHIKSITERVQIDGTPLNDNKFLSYLEIFLDKIVELSSPELSYFELLTAFAYWVFREEKVDYAVIETGLGGIKDATNTVSRKNKVSVITPIGLDHVDILGQTIAEIAFQKAGIINENSQVFIAKQSKHALVELKKAAAKKCAVLDEVSFDDRTPVNMVLYQKENFSLALTVFSYVCRRDELKSISSNAIKKASLISPPGRFEIFRIGEKVVILDGAHNPQKFSTLQNTLADKKIEPDTCLIAFSVASEDKITKCVQNIASGLERAVVTGFNLSQDFNHRKNESVNVVAGIVKNQRVRTEICSDPISALERALKITEHTLLITGSLYLVASVYDKVTELSNK